MLEFLLLNIFKRLHRSALLCFSTNSPAVIFNAVATPTAAWAGDQPTSLFSLLVLPDQLNQLNRIPASRQET
jgi:hypothetical protein